MTTQEKILIVAKFATDEPEILNNDLKKAGTMESLQHYATDWNSLMDVIEKISHHVSGGITYSLKEALITADIDKAFNEVFKIVRFINEKKK